MVKKMIIFSWLLMVLLVGTYFSTTKEDKVIQNKKKHKYSNHLQGQSSPYLLLHAHNPVDWYPWGNEALEKAKKENKLIIVSIGYAACHWCHVMEEESFSDEEVAEIMNKHFISIKVDREERPDIDSVYMSAAQLISGSGGWPLNAIALPDGRPIVAATYFPKKNWISLLSRIQALYDSNPAKLKEQAELITKGIQNSDLIPLNTDKEEFNHADLDAIFSKWKPRLDYNWGGETGTPKFPLPIGYRFLLHYHFLTKEQSALDAVNITLQRMARGGIYDQVGGGFARYATDNKWVIPHFEKMLYDNAQLVSLYSYAYQLTKNTLYKRVVSETLEFVEREFTAPPTRRGGLGFYSSLDADSQGEEGLFYTWGKAEINDILGKEAELFNAYFNVTSAGNWENGRNILFRTLDKKTFAKKYNLTREQLQVKLDRARAKMFKAREKRVHPALDDKILTSWNALMLTGYVDAYRVFGNEKYLDRAKNNAQFIMDHMYSGEGSLYRNHKNGKSTINGFLDDYAFTIKAFTALYSATFDEKWLFEANKLTQYTMEHFFDSKSSMFYYTSDLDPALIARKMETTDNVTPSSNSVMAENLYMLGEYLYKERYIEIARQMVKNVKSNLAQGGAYYANWSTLMTYFIHKPYEVAIVGDNYKQIRQELDRRFLPNMILMGGATEGKLPLMKNKLAMGQTTIYVCKNKACKMPVTTSAEALEQMK